MQRVRGGRMIAATFSTAEAAAAFAFGRLACADVVREEARHDPDPGAPSRGRSAACAMCLGAGAANGLRVALGRPAETFVAVLAGPRAAAAAEETFLELTVCDVQVARRELLGVEILLCRIATAAGRPA